jgi:hypothetical protein
MTLGNSHSSSVSTKEESGEMNKPAGRPWWNWRKIALAVGVLAGLYASYAIIFLPQKDRVGSRHQTKSYPKDQKQTCMEVSIYDSVPFETGGPSESKIGSAPGEVAWFGYPYWMIITQAREKIRDLGPNWPIMNHRLLVAFMTREDAEGFVKATYPTAIVCGEMTPRSDTYDVALIARSYQKREWGTAPPKQ